MKKDESEAVEEEIAEEQVSIFLGIWWYILNF